MLRGSGSFEKKSSDEGRGEVEKRGQENKRRYWHLERNLPPLIYLISLSPLWVVFFPFRGQTFVAMFLKPRLGGPV